MNLVESEQIKIRIKFKDGWALQIMSTNPQKDMKTYHEVYPETFAGAEVIRDETPLNSFIMGKFYVPPKEEGQ